jgi:hypothetical protein
MFFEPFLQDLRIGLRVLLKEKGFYAVGVSVESRLPIHSRMRPSPRCSRRTPE